MLALNQNTPIQIDRNFEMPSIPLVLTRIIRLLDDDTASARQLEDLILHDPSLSARILKLANSAFYSFHTEVKTVSHGIALLGLGLVKSLAIGVTLFESFTRGMKSEAALIKMLWMHSFGTGLLAREIWTRRAVIRKETEFAFLAGLLHDLGKVVLFKKSPLQYSTLFLKQKMEGDPDLSAMEAESFGVDHAYLGSVLAKQWGFPAELVDIIRMHHAALDSKATLVAAVCLADSVAKQAQIGFSGDQRVCPEFLKLQVQLAMSPEECERLKLLAAEKRQEIQRFFEMSS